MSYQKFHLTRGIEERERERVNSIPQIIALIALMFFHFFTLLNHITNAVKTNAIQSMRLNLK